MAQSPFLRLPVELHRDIIDYLEIQDKARLQGTSRYFATLIQPLKHEEFLAAEAKTWATSKQLFACKGCTSFQHLLRFSDDMRKGKRGRRGEEAHTRYCVKCGVDRHIYTPGTKVAILGQPWVVCKQCVQFTDQVGCRGSCSQCRPCSRAAVRIRKDRRSASLFDRERDPGSSSWSCISDKRLEDVYAWCSSI